MCFQTVTKVHPKQPAPGQHEHIDARCDSPAGVSVLSVFVLTWRRLLFFCDRLNHSCRVSLCVCLSPQASFSGFPPCNRSYGKKRSIRAALELCVAFLWNAAGEERPPATKSPGWDAMVAELERVTVIRHGYYPR